MGTVRSEVVVARPRGAVFDYLADVSRHCEWERDLVRTEMADPGPVGVGTRGVEVRRMVGREVRSPFVITRHEPPERQDFHTTGGVVRPDGVLRCDEDGAGTRVTYEITVRGPLAPLMARMIRRGLERDLATVKQMLEAKG